MNPHVVFLQLLFLPVLRHMLGILRYTRGLPSLLTDCVLFRTLHHICFYW